ncbi:MAG TPA: hypothetical protein DEB25_02630 [Desulfobulbaceae bacterium]|nr:hypothetical protein [Desulfobulbaceae bacterium]
MIVNLIEFLKARSKLVRHGGYGIVAAIVIWSLIVIDRHHVHSWLEKIPGFWSLFTIVSALVLVFVAKAWAKTGIETDEDYYDR